MKSEWPGESTGKSVQQWLRRQSGLRDRETSASKKGETFESDYNNHVFPPVHDGQRMTMDRPINSAPASEPRMYHVYNKLVAMDILISAEHCWSCEHHSMHTR